MEIPNEFIKAIESEAAFKEYVINQIAVELRRLWDELEEEDKKFENEVMYGTGEDEPVGILKAE